MISCKYISFLHDFVYFKSFFRKKAKGLLYNGAKAPTMYFLVTNYIFHVIHSIPLLFSVLLVFHSPSIFLFYTILSLLYDVHHAYMDLVSFVFHHVRHLMYSYYSLLCNYLCKLYIILSRYLSAKLKLLNKINISSKTIRPNTHKIFKDA